MIDPFDGSDSHSPPPGRDATHPPGRISVLGLMVAVALIGVVLGAFRIHFSLGSFVAGMIAIAVVRTRRMLRAARPDTQSPGGRSGLGLFVRSLVDAACLLCLTVVPCVILVFMIFIDYRRDPPSVKSQLKVIVIVALLGWPLSVQIRREMRWPQ